MQRPLEDSTLLGPDLGPDLLALLGREASPVVAVSRVSPLASPGWRRAAFRVELADGTVRKARRFESAEAARRHVTLAGRLPAAAFPRILAHQGEGVVAEWIVGDAPAADPPPLDVCRRAGSILRSVHDVSIDGAFSGDLARRAAALYPGPAWRDRLAERIDLLCRAEALTAAEGARALALAESHAPGPSRVGLVLGDLAPEHLLVDATGSLRIVDVDGVDLHAPPFDLARTWYRWPMSDDERRAFEDGYAAADALACCHAHFVHWAVVVLVSAAHFRVRHELPGASAPLNRLRQML